LKLLFISLHSAALQQHVRLSSYISTVRDVVTVNADMPTYLPLLTSSRAQNAVFFEKFSSFFYVESNDSIDLLKSLLKVLATSLTVRHTPYSTGESSQKSFFLETPGDTGSEF